MRFVAPLWCLLPESRPLQKVLPDLAVTTRNSEDNSFKSHIPPPLPKTRQIKVSTTNSIYLNCPSWPYNLVDINWNVCRKSRKVTLSSAYPQAVRHVKRVKRTRSTSWSANGTFRSPESLFPIYFEYRLTWPMAKL